MTYCNAGPHLGKSVIDINTQSVRTLTKMNSRKKVSYSQGTIVIKIIFKIHFYNLFICTHMRSYSLSFKKCTIYIEKQ